MRCATAPAIASVRRRNAGPTTQRASPSQTRRISATGGLALRHNATAIFYIYIPLYTCHCCSLRETRRTRRTPPRIIVYICARVCAYDRVTRIIYCVCVDPRLPKRARAGSSWRSYGFARRSGTSTPAETNPVSLALSLSLRGRR